MATRSHLEVAGPFNIHQISHNFSYIDRCYMVGQNWASVRLGEITSEMLALTRGLCSKTVVVFVLYQSNLTNNTNLFQMIYHVYPCVQK